MKIKNKTNKAKSDMLPLMDCMFILLIYFIFSMLSMVLHSGIPIKLPKLEDKTEISNKVYEIKISEKGILSLDKQLITLPELKIKLKELRKITAKIPIYIASDKNAEFKHSIILLDLMRELKINDVSFETNAR